MIVPWLIEVLQAFIQTLSGLPLLILVAITAPIAVLAYLWKIYPSRMMVAGMVVPCLMTLTLVLKHDAIPLILTVDAVLVCIAIGDLLLLPSVKDFTIERDCQRVASLGKKHRVTLMITNTSKSERLVRIKDDNPQEFEQTPDELALTLRPRSRTSLHYDFTASRRGAFQLETVHLGLRSRLRLWNRFVKYPLESTVNVYPDMKQLGEYALLARTNRLSLMGVRRTRHIGQDNEFERLRDYTLDDNYKHIDWRSTARRNKLTVKDFQTNQSQRVIFMLDCGRMMTNVSRGISLLDHSLNAMLMLSYVALERGDSVGLIAFSDQIHSFVPPKADAAK